jgi:TonB family protein
MKISKTIEPSQKIFRSMEGNRNIQAVSLLNGILIPVILLFLFTYFNATKPADPTELTNELLLSGGGGGGGNNGMKELTIEFGQPPIAEAAAMDNTPLPDHLTIISIHVQDATQSKTDRTKDRLKSKSRQKIQPSSIVSNYTPVRHIRGSGPGSGGGTGGGSGGGIGNGTGYSINWGGNGSRRLLSGRLPQYPENTDKEMRVTLEFSVLPDGSVSSIVPVLKADESLEHAAILGLETWRFEPLSALVEQKVQTGRVTFNFKLIK